MLLPLFITTVLVQAITSQEGPGSDECVGSSCYPETGDLLIGRKNRLRATSTCGLKKPQQYCVISDLHDKKKCFICDDVSIRNRHPVENIVRRFGETRSKTWWQAENGVHNVSIQLNLEAEFHFTHLVMTFKTFRPKAMFVERSYDFGDTWKIYRYFAQNCRRSFPGIPLGPVRNIKDVICEEKYSAVAPSSGGEVVFRVLPPSIEVRDPYSPEVQDLLKLTNLRVNFTELHTLGDVLLDSRPEILEKYYYSMYEMVVRGSCSCYGHASRCVPHEGQSNEKNVVHGKCECTHNTKGFNCEQCEDFYNDLPWRPAVGNLTNACRRCNCNSHASRCHFDAAVYAASGNVSGGVCDDCQHNTMGRNCEECQPFFYKDPRRDIRDPLICQPCNCDPIGAENGGECEQETDVFNDLVAGRCICKRFVTGDRCDVCQDGYWNLTPDNPDGCEECACSRLGTVGNYGCNKLSGECECKRYVTGRYCDTCMAEYWGLSEDEFGCKPCDCDIGGAYGNDCDAVTGQCSCRPNIIGRRCDQPRPGYFITYLDFLAYEAEYALGTGNTQIVIREPTPGRPMTWTGPGFMKVTEGDTLEFTIDDIPSSMFYHIVIRYEPQMREIWDDVRVTVIRPGPVDQTGPCSNHVPQDDFKSTGLPSGDESSLGLPVNRFYTVSPPSCLEKGVKYIIKLDFNRYKSDRETKDAMMLIDSIILVPVPTSLSIFKPDNAPDDLVQEYNRYQCEDLLLRLNGRDKLQLPEICKQLIFSIGATVYEKALDCQCDPTGSVSTECASLGGQCQCKPNVIGRRCDQCAPGTYGFGPRGCTPCNCDNRGSRDNFCDIQSGLCICQPGIYGRQCDRCQPGYYSFPTCRPCQCNGHADTCEDRTGRCEGCRDFTTGDNCDKCEVGYYGDPRLGRTIPCRPCQCPNGLQNADSCELDQFTQDLKCHCRPGYAGPQCDRCADNFYGNPLVPGGTCEMCQCNGNIDQDEPGSCDSQTGECLKCLYNTEGYACQHCKPGYYGDALTQNCQQCVCNTLGTQGYDRGVCDRVTGQCPCLPNVEGVSCDRCAPNHWKIASGEGCELCDCDPQGSRSTQCNEFDGQCSCIPGRGGRTCSDCEANYWGDPNIGCFPCDCNLEGSLTQQCDRRTGQCECLTGVAGDKCDRCARGTTGVLPNCVPCGECFDDWDKIIMDLAAQTRALIVEASQIKQTGVAGAFNQEFDEMQTKLNEVKDIIANFGNRIQTDPIVKSLQAIRQNLTETSSMLDTVQQNITDTRRPVLNAETRMNVLKNRIQKVSDLAKTLYDNATSLQEQDILGAYNEIIKSHNRSTQAQLQVDGSQAFVEASADTRKQVDDLITSKLTEFNDKTRDNDIDLTDIQDQVSAIDGRIIDLNEAVCDGRGDPCDNVCGGAGCGKCGGEPSCVKGAVTKAQNADTYATDALDILTRRNVEAVTLLQNVQGASLRANMSKDAAQKVYNDTLAAKNQSEGIRDDIRDLLDRIAKFMGTKGATGDQIKLVVDEVLAMSISLTPEQITDLANQIKDTIKGLTDIEKILNETKSDLEKAQTLKDDADIARTEAERILDTVEAVTNKLKDAKTIQDNAEDATSKALEEVDKANKALTQIESETEAGLDKAEDNLERAKKLKKDIKDLRQTYTENDVRVRSATTAATDAESAANAAEQAANDLEKQYKEAMDKLAEKERISNETKQRAQFLEKRAQAMAEDITQKNTRLKVMERDFGKNEKILVDLSSKIAELLKRIKQYNSDIGQRSQEYNRCDPTPP